jgi:hypothetical protein
MERGKPVWMCAAPFASAMQNPDTLAAISALAPDALRGNVAQVARGEYLQVKDGRAPTLGQWGLLP